ncbi:MAG: ABC transporter permease subunit [Pararhodobacter sp.]|nr:ABC transporter permease subunit [Pararhodobacter sp.]
MRDPVALLMRLLALAGWILMLAPLFVVAGLALNAAEVLAFPPRQVSLRWFSAALGHPVFMASLWTSLTLAAATTVLALVLGTTAALGLARLGRKGALAAAIMTAPILMPGMVIGFAIYLFYVWSRLGLTGSFAGLLAGHVLVATPWVITTVLAAASRLDPALPEVARSLGAGPVTLFTRITLPGLAPGIVAGGIFAFVVSFSQFEVSLFLGTSERTPLPVALFTSLMNRSEPVIAAVGVVAILVVVAALALVNRLFSVSVLFGGSTSRQP